MLVFGSPPHESCRRGQEATSLRLCDIVARRRAPAGFCKGMQRPLLLERLEERTLLTLAQAALASELAAGAYGSELVSCPVPTSAGLPALATADSATGALAAPGSTLLSVPPH